MSDDLKKVFRKLKEMGYDLFDINDVFYQDICVPFTTPYGTDVLLTDRITYFFHNNETICQSNCNPVDYIEDTRYLKCDCDISNSEINTREIDKFTPELFYSSFEDTLKFSNYKVLFCYKLPFRINSVTTNIGSIISIIYFIIYLIFLIIFCFKDIHVLKIYFNNILKNIKGKKIRINSAINNHNHISLIKVQRKNKLPAKNKKEFLYSKSEHIKKESFIPNNSNLFLERYDGKNSSIIEKKLSLNPNSEIFMIKDIDKNSNITEIQKDIQDEKSDNNEISSINNDKKDIKSFLKVYWSLLRKKHLIIFTFLVKNDNNLIYIKLERFIFLVCSEMALNVFFYADETMHKTFLDYGKYNFLQQIPQIIYSTLVSSLIDILVCFFGLTEEQFDKIKKLKHNSIEEKNKIIKNIKLKIIIFFVFTFLMFSFFWYTIACFCSVYENTQIAFIKDSISSFGLGLIYPFFIYFALAVYKFKTSKDNKEKKI